MDSNVLISYHNKKDIFTQRALLLLERIKKSSMLFISDYIFDECIGVVLRKSGYKEALMFGEEIKNSEIKILKVSESMLDAAWSYFKEKNKGTLSFTDCVNIVTAIELNFDYIATFDKDYEAISGIRIIKA